MRYTRGKDGITMISVTQYAESRGVSGPAVRRQLARYAKELEGHVITSGRKRMLDDEAVAFLDQHRMQRTVIVDGEEVSLSDQVTALHEKVKELEDSSLAEQVEILRRELEASQRKVMELQDNVIGLLEHKHRNQLLLESNKEKDQQILKQETEIQEKNQEILQRDAELHGKAQELKEKEAEIKQKADDLEQKDAVLTETKEKLQGAEEELSKYKKSWFGFYRKIKK